MTEREATGFQRTNMSMGPLVGTSLNQIMFQAASLKTGRGGNLRRQNVRTGPPRVENSVVVGGIVSRRRVFASPVEAWRGEEQATSCIPQTCYSGHTAL